ncbi:exo-alpha-sialidase [Nitrosomonas mobilis]|uniref:Exo-alpha-sialidase n=1 Tax=Nitrosomonas mobilis TaxID=51642 RepID=A0A1G5SC42_9PROT|nr:exo-alpha-sialidase [Nitrosomonas mobilis]SCZ84380.1 conserved exported hypothetical protein [Nitrosomonas mobilis]
MCRISEVVTSGATLFLVWTLFCLLAANCQAQTGMIGNPAEKGARLPRLTTVPDGSILLSWVETIDGGKQNEQHVLRYAIRSEGRWIRTGTVAKGENWFINWADFPSVVVINDDFWVAHWLVRSPGGRSYDYDIHLSISTDGGLNWQPAIKPHRDGVAAEHGFVSIFPIGDDGAGIIWLDGRDNQTGGTGKFALRYTRLDRDGVLHAEEVIDADTCTCCWTTAAASVSGPVIAWRSRRDGQIRDHHVTRMEDNKWAKPAHLGRDGWSIDACPVNGPGLIANNNQVVAAWFTAAASQPAVRAALSHDAGKHFSKPLEIDTNQPLGRISLAWLDERTAAITWLGAIDKTSRQSPLMLRKLSLDGKLYPAFKILDIDPGFATGVPQMVREDNGRLMLAWTAPAPEYGIRTLILSAH